MANRCTLHKTHLDEFKAYLDAHCIAYRPGKGDFQVLQVLTVEHGWQVIFRRLEMPEHFTVQDKLMYLVHAFLAERNYHELH